MAKHSLPRRRFLKDAGLVAGAALAGAASAQAAPSPKPGPRLHVASNHYPWLTYYRRDGRDFNQSLDAGFAEVARSGMDGFEPMITSPEDVERIGPLLRKRGLQMRSLYINSALYEPAEAEKSVQMIVAVAEKVMSFGTRIIVTNPTPIRWGGPENKDDAQLRVQAKALEKLGRELAARRVVLSYHNHDIELRNAAREFHHMMVGTDPRYVTLCLDAHWIYRGSGNSTVALEDVLKLYGPRVTELHLRQSKDTIWTESFGEGDIDYPALANYLLSIGVKPHLVMEQAVEKGTPKTMDGLEAHRRSGEYARKVFAAFV